MKMHRSTAGLNSQAVDEASAWFVEFRSGDVDAQAREDFNAWLRASPAHIHAYLEIAGTYAGLAPSGAQINLDVEKLIAAARDDRNVVDLPAGFKWDGAREAARSHPSRTTRRLLPWSAAAAVVLAIGAALVWERYFHETYATQIGEQRSLTLADGSRVDLNARSKVRIRMGDSRRQVELLQGQALFSVAKDPNRPFIVSTDDVNVRAVGTSFDVNRATRGTTVTVLEGRVAATGNAQPREILLAAGQQLTLTGMALPKPVAANVAAATAWTQRRLVFEGTPLADVVEEFNRYNTRQLVLEDDRLANFHISGVYASPDPASLLNFLKSEPGIAVTESEREISIARR